MSASELTKTAMEQTLKKLLHEIPINKITVSMVTKQCGLSRNTFYHHFTDIYDLIGSMFEHEVIEELETCRNLANWKRGFMLVLNYTLTNKLVCLNVYRSMWREHLELFLYRTFQDILEGVIDDILEDESFDQTFEHEISDFYSYAITGEFLFWLHNGMKEEPDCILKRVEPILDGTIKRIVLDYKK